MSGPFGGPPHARRAPDTAPLLIPRPIMSRRYVVLLSSGYTLEVCTPFPQKSRLNRHLNCFIPVALFLEISLFSLVPKDHFLLISISMILICNLRGLNPSGFAYKYPSYYIKSSINYAATNLSGFIRQEFIFIITFYLLFSRGSKKVPRTII